MSLRMFLRAPAIALVLAFTAVPIDVRPVAATPLDLFQLRLNIPDIVLNVIGYLPIGVVFAGCRAWTMLAAAVAISGLAETSQIFAVGRAPSAIDLATNVTGAALGWFVAQRLHLRSLSVPVGPKVALTAALLALVHVAVGARYLPREMEEVAAGLVAAQGALRSPVNDRGGTAPGKLEGLWSFDDSTRDVAHDVSGNGLDGRLVGGARTVPAPSGGALALNGNSQYVDLGDPTDLRLTGSVTLSAWMSARPSSGSEAAIVSRRGRFGYQLDTTTFRGPTRVPRTLAFRLTNATGRQMVRFGRTPLQTNNWYHVAGVYDAPARTLSVYVNGRLDNGCLAGDVTSSQILSQSSVLIGRSARRPAAWFRGTLDDLRIYSRALTPGEVVADMRTNPRAASVVAGPEPAPEWDGRACVARIPDARVAGLFVGFGLLVAIACAGLWRRPGFRLPAVAMSVVAGFLLLPSVPETLPQHYRNVIPLLTMAGGVAAVISMQYRGKGRT